MQLTKEQRELVEKNCNLIYGYCKFRNISVEEYYGDLAVSLCEAVKSYDKNKANLSTYIYGSFELTMKRLYKKRKKESGYTFLNIQDLTQNRKDLPISSLADYGIEYKCFLKDKELQNIINLLLEGYSKEEIIKMFNLNRSIFFKKIKKIKEIAYNVLHEI